MGSLLRHRTHHPTSARASCWRSNCKSLSKAHLTFALILALHPHHLLKMILMPYDFGTPSSRKQRSKGQCSSDDHSFHVPSDYPLPHPDTFELTDDDDDVEMAGSFDRFVEAQREDNGVHFEAGGSGALVEPQSAPGRLSIRISLGFLPSGSCSG
ncbi:hypothetical protein ACN38_g1344 [Penicillium nordicum]|uniref:Uncharacterized protein n=1 Tax=Penicillium nordicum TaxID=229535 RepID=A0A0N0RZX4_9EURO|nr:hypothetical protein ACN38_g1344 [Penicillium nordicum]